MAASLASGACFGGVPRVCFSPVPFRPPPAGFRPPPSCGPPLFLALVRPSALPPRGGGCPAVLIGAHIIPARREQSRWGPFGGPVFFAPSHTYKTKWTPPSNTRTVHRGPPYPASLRDAARQAGRRAAGGSPPLGPLALGRHPARCAVLGPTRGPPLRRSLRYGAGPALGSSPSPRPSSALAGDGPPLVAARSLFRHGAGAPGLRSGISTSPGAPAWAGGAPSPRRRPGLRRFAPARHRAGRALLGPAH